MPPKLRLWPSVEPRSDRNRASTGSLPVTPMPKRAAALSIAVLMMGVFPAAPARGHLSAFGVPELEATDRCGHTAKQRKKIRKGMNIASPKQKRKVMRKCKYRKTVVVRITGPKVDHFNPEDSAVGPEGGKKKGCDTYKRRWLGGSFLVKNVLTMNLRWHFCWWNKKTDDGSGWKGRVKNPSLGVDGRVAWGFFQLAWDYIGPIDKYREWDNCGGGWHSCVQVFKEVKFTNCIVRIGCVQTATPTFVGFGMAGGYPNGWGYVDCVGTYDPIKRETKCRY